MQITEKSHEGLKRAYQITIPAEEISARIDAEVHKIAPQVRMPGFRPGKVPANLVRKMHGEQLHGQALNDLIRESIDKVITQNKLRPAMQPEIALNDGYEQGKDAMLDVSFEVLPEFETPSVDGLKLERLVVPVSEERIEEALGEIARQAKSYKDAPKSHKAAEGDQLMIDFVGRIDGEEFEGGKAEDVALVLGSNQFIPGFEEQLIGGKAGDKKTITVPFPEDYPAEHLKGKQAEFDVTVKQVKLEGETRIDDDFAQTLGFESLDKVKEVLRGQLEQQTAGLTRTQMKRQLLDQLAAQHDFPVPERMVEAEFEQIWAQLEAEARREEDPEAALAQIEAEKDDYRAIAERRVRLGLLLSQIGQANGVEVTAQEMSMLIQQAAQQYRPEDRQRFIEYVQREPMAAAQLRAPLYEDKVVDFIFDKAEVTVREVSQEELEAAIEAEAESETPKGKKGAGKASKAPAKKAPASKTAAKKTEKSARPKAEPAKKEAAKAPAKAPAKKEAAKKASAKKPASSKAAKK